MVHEPIIRPALYPGVTVSSTFSDLQKHRLALLAAVGQSSLKPVGMEDDAAKLEDVIDSSLQKVRDGSAYIGIIGHRYGQTPECPRRNPGRLSITELEFNEALRLKRPILLFIMADDRPAPTSRRGSRARRHGPESRASQYTPARHTAWAVRGSAVGPRRPRRPGTPPRGAGARADRVALSRKSSTLWNTA